MPPAILWSNSPQSAKNGLLIYGDEQSDTGGSAGFMLLFSI
jgi:hypothetical protein